MGIFKKAEKPRTKDKDIFTRIEYNLNNDHNLQCEKKVMADVRFPLKDNLYTIDLLMISEKGFFIIKPLNATGQIQGTETGEMWRNIKMQFENPINENLINAKALASYLKIPLDKISSYIVLQNNSSLRTLPYSSEKYIATREDDLYYFLGLHTRLLPTLYTKEQIMEYRKRLDKMNIIKQLTN